MLILIIITFITILLIINLLFELYHNHDIKHDELYETMYYT